MIYKKSEIEDLDKFISDMISKYGNCSFLFNGEYVHVIFDPADEGIGNEGRYSEADEIIKSTAGKEKREMKDK